MSASRHWAGLELRHLVALQAIAEHRSFHRAAARLDYTQSGISQQINALERIVGEQLIDRPGGSRPVRLTKTCSRGRSWGSVASSASRPADAPRGAIRRTHHVASTSCLSWSRSRLEWSA